MKYDHALLYSPPFSKFSFPTTESIKGPRNAEVEAQVDAELLKHSYNYKRKDVFVADGEAVHGCGAGRASCLQCTSRRRASVNAYAIWEDATAVTSIYTSNSTSNSASNSASRATNRATTTCDAAGAGQRGVCRLCDAEAEEEDEEAQAEEAQAEGEGRAEEAVPRPLVPPEEQCPPDSFRSSKPTCPPGQRYVNIPTVPGMGSFQNKTCTYQFSMQVYKSNTKTITTSE